MHRVNDIKNQLSSKQPQKPLFSTPKAKSDDDVVIVAALRTPLTKANKGGLKDTAPETLLAHVLRAVVDSSGIDPAIIDDIQVGNVLQPSIGAFTARMAQMLANIPLKVPISSVNRQCSSGLESCALIAAKIKSGTIKVGIGCGVESMSFYDMSTMINVSKVSKQVKQNTLANDCLIPMGETSDIMAHQYGLSRAELDKFSVESHKRAYKARQSGFFVNEIVPITTTVINSEGKEVEVTVKEDDGIRGDSNIDSMAKMKPAFGANGFSHAGSSSQKTDGAAAILLMSRATANALGLKIIAKFIAHTVIGVPPRIMGIGPTEAIPLLLKDVNLAIKDIDCFEINEAFASVVVLAVKHLGLDESKVNPNGGAIAFGHPLGCTGARQIATLVNHLKRTGGKFGVVSMCLGAGMGAAALIENED